MIPSPSPSHNGAPGPRPTSPARAFPDGAARGAQAPEIRALHLRKAFDEHVVLDDVSLEIKRGEIVAIVGGSGSGKTILLDHLTGLMAPDAGRVEVADHDQPGAPMQDLAGIDPDRLDRIRLHWAVVFQRNALFSGSVFENVALWLREHTKMSEEQIAARVGDSLKAVSLNVDDVMDKDRAELSGGMAKRVAIARAIAVEPLVTFYDEPTTGLDPVIGNHIVELIWNLHNRPHAAGAPRTTIIVTHDRELLRRMAPRIIMLGGGKVVFEGPYEQFTAAAVPQAVEYLTQMPVLNARTIRPDLRGFPRADSAARGPRSSGGSAPPA